MAKDESEFGGQAGIIQPEPHKPTAREQAMIERKMNPADPSDNPEAARARLNGEVSEQ